MSNQNPYGSTPEPQDGAGNSPFQQPTNNNPFDSSNPADNAGQQFGGQQPQGGQYGQPQQPGQYGQAPQNQQFGGQQPQGGQYGQPQQPGQYGQAPQGQQFGNQYGQAPQGQQFGGQQPQQPGQYGQPQQQGQFAQPGQPQPQGQQGPGIGATMGKNLDNAMSTLQSKPIHQLVAGGFGILALLQLIIGFLSWYTLKMNMSFLGVTVEGKATINGFGYVKSVFTSTGEGSEKHTEWASDFTILQILIIGFLVAAAVMVFKRIKPKVATILGGVAAGLSLIYIIYFIVGSSGKVEDDGMDEFAAEMGDAFSTGYSFGFWLAILAMLATAGLVAWVFMKKLPELEATAVQPANAGGPGAGFAGGAAAGAGQFGQTPQNNGFGQNPQGPQNNGFGQNPQGQQAPQGGQPFGQNDYDKGSQNSYGRHSAESTDDAGEGTDNK